MEFIKKICRFFGLVFSLPPKPSEKNNDDTIRYGLHKVLTKKGIKMISWKMVKFKPNSYEVNPFTRKSILEMCSGWLEKSKEILSRQRKSWHQSKHIILD